MTKGDRVITTLWGGNGIAERCDVRLGSGEVVACVAKRIQCPQDNSVDANRKRSSYHNELAFYRDVAPELLAHSPCMVPQPIELSAGKSAITLILADVSAEFPVSQDTLSSTQTKAALEWLATFHAQYWEAPHKHRGLAKRGSYWFLDTRQEELKRIDPRKNQRILRSAPALDARLKGVVFDKGERHYSPRYQTLVHGDFKPANIQFSPDGRHCVAYDFQYAGRGYGAIDVCYLLYPNGLDNRALLHHYHQALSAALAPEHTAPSLEHFLALVELSFLDFYRFLLGWYYHNTRPPAKLERAALNILNKIDGGTLLSARGYDDAVAAVYPLPS